MMSMTNVSYYVNKFYWDYIIRNDTNILAFRTWWGMSEFIRVMLNWTTWSLTLVFWAITFVPSASTSGLFYAHLARMFVVLMMKVLSFFMDSYADEYQYYPYEIMWGGDDSDTAIDYSLELSTFIGQMIAYPLMQHSYKNIENFENTKDMMQEYSKQSFGETTLPTPEDEVDGRFEDDSSFW